MMAASERPTVTPTLIVVLPNSFIRFPFAAARPARRAPSALRPRIARGLRLSQGGPHPRGRYEAVIEPTQFDVMNSEIIGRRGAPKPGLVVAQPTGDAPRTTGTDAGR